MSPIQIYINLITYKPILTLIETHITTYNTPMIHYDSHAIFVAAVHESRRRAGAEVKDTRPCRRTIDHSKLRKCRGWDTPISWPRNMEPLQVFTSFYRFDAGSEQVCASYACV